MSTFMPALAPAAHFSKVFSDFLGSDIAIAAGAPALTDVQRRHLTSAVNITNPNLLIDVEVTPESSDEFLILTVKLMLTVQLGAEAGQTSAAQAESWFKSFRALLSDDPAAFAAWGAWIAALSDNYKDGWFAQYFVPQPTESELNKDTNVLTLTAPYTVSSFWNN